MVFAKWFKNNVRMYRNKIIFTTVSQTPVYSGHSFDIYTFIQHTFCLYLEALNRPHGRHAKVIIGADIIHNRQTSP